MDRRDFLQKSTLAGAGALLITGVNCATSSQAGRLAGKRVLFVYGGWEGHKPVESRDLYVPWMESEGAIVTVSPGLEIYANDTHMRQFDLIVQTWTMGEIPEMALNGLRRSIQRGVGIAGWHGGLSDAFRNSPDYQFIIGGQFVSHPGGIIPYRVNISESDDPIVAGLKDFDVETEQYYMHVDPNNTVLATTEFSGEHAPWIKGARMPVVWKRMHGYGRVFFSALGHKLEDHAVPEAREIMQRGIIWASNSKQDGVEALVSPRY